MKQKDKRSSGAVDVYVGNRIRAARNIAGVTQDELGQKLGVSFQQIQKYEKGVNRVTLGRAVEIAEALGVTLLWLIEGFDEVKSRKVGKKADPLAAMAAVPHGFALANAFVAIKNNQDRGIITTLAERLAFAT